MTRASSTNAAMATDAGDDLAAVIARAATGDAGAWRALVGSYGPRLYALARSRGSSPEHAEEIMQSVLVTLSSKLTDASTDGAYTELGRFEAWLFRIAINRIRDAARKRKRHAEAKPAIAGGAAARTAASTHDASGALTGDLDALRVAMAGLPDADREIVTMRHHGGLSFNQIADILDEPVGTLLARHHRALRKLRTMIEAQASSPESDATRRAM